jgi:hypothetical protein
MTKQRTDGKQMNRNDFDRPTYLDNEFRQVFRNLGAPDRVAGIDPDRWVRYCKRSGATTVFMDFRSQVYAYHPSAFVPKDPVLGARDLAAEFAAAAKKHGLKFCAYIAPAESETLAPGHDDWQQRTADGSLEVKNWGPTKRTVFCYNTGFGKLFAGHLREVAERYRPHGFFIDGVIFGFSACYCETCKALFRAETGQEMPLKPDWTSPLWHRYLDWRYRQVEGIGRLIHEAVHTVDPRITVVWNCGYAGGGWPAAQSVAQARWLDTPCLELLPSGMWGGQFGWGYSYAEELAWGMSLNRALRFGRWGHHYSYFTPMTRRAEIVTTANVAAAFGAQGCVQEHCRHLGDYLERFREVEPWLVDAESAADVALHYSVLAQNAYYRPNSHGDMPAAQRDCRGIYKALLNSHRPVDIVTDEWLGGESLSRFRAVVLPNSVCLPPAAVTALQAYVRNGGTVVATMETGLRDATGQKVGDELLWPGSGLRWIGQLASLPAHGISWTPDDVPILERDMSATPDQFLMFRNKAAMKAWIGEDITLAGRADGFERREIGQFQETPSVHVGARAGEVVANQAWKTVLSMSVRRDKKRGFETLPAVLMRRFGKGRLFYVNFQAGEQAAGAGSMIGMAAAHPWWRCFLRHLVDLAAGRPAVRVEAPVCVKTALWKQAALKRTVLHVVNELSGVGVQNLQREDLIPVRARVTLALPGVRSVKVVVGRKGSRVRRVGKTWEIELNGLCERAVIVCAP